MRLQFGLREDWHENTGCLVAQDLALLTKARTLIRYLINSPMLPEMKKNPDGSLSLYIQKDSPGAGLESNWLPGPDGPIYLVMRLYWPKETPPSILPPGEGTWKPPGVKRVE